MNSCCCSGPGWCERHQVKKNATWWKLCQRPDYFLLWERGKGPGQNLGVAKPPVRQCLGLGDRVEKALKMVGITEERVTKWIGRPCGCKERRERLNRIGSWAMDTLKGVHADPARALLMFVKEEEE